MDGSTLKQQEYLVALGIPRELSQTWDKQHASDVIYGLRIARRRAQKRLARRAYVELSDPVWNAQHQNIIENVMRATRGEG